MRPLFHPSMTEVTVEGILHALSDPIRVAMYADIIAQECPQNCSNFLKISDKAIPKSTLSQHFKILREAGLIRSERHGVELQNVSRCTELEQRVPGLIRAIVAAHAIQSADEARAKMATPKRSARRAEARWDPRELQIRKLLLPHVILLSLTVLLHSWKPVLRHRGDSGEAERWIRDETERDSGMIPNTIGA
jgi:DNA-binding transcriptional ArsR family regulator